MSIDPQVASRLAMLAKQVMTTNVITVQPDTPVEEVARTLLENRIGAVPVVDSQRRVLGIVSEGDLIRRPESATERSRSRWLSLFLAPEEQVIQYVKSHGRLAQDVMTKNVIVATGDTDLKEIATLIEENNVKHIPIVEGKKLVGIISRANLLHGLVTAKIATDTQDVEDETIRVSILESLRENADIPAGFINVTVSEGTVHLWGAVESETAKTAAFVVAENTPGVRTIENHLSVLPPMIRSMV